jgi:glutaredoxin
MNNRLLLLLIPLFFIPVQYVAAVSVYQCEDERGNKTFQDHCPPGTTEVTRKDYSTTTPVVNTGSKPALTLYTIPGCDTCEQLREFLSIRNLQVTEKNVADDVNLQNELKDLAGELQVPVLLVGSKVLTGYNRTALIEALTVSGHITEGTK